MSGSAEKKVDTRFALPVFEKDFHRAAARSVADERLRSATSDACIKKDEGRQMRLSTELRDAEALRDLAARIKEHTIEHLPHYLEVLAENVRRNGGVVHFAKTAKDANAVIVEIAQGRMVCQLIVKSKSMASEETRLNDAAGGGGADAGGDRSWRADRAVGAGSAVAPGDADHAYAGEAGGGGVCEVFWCAVHGGSAAVGGDGAGVFAGSVQPGGHGNLRGELCGGRDGVGGDLHQ